MTFQILTRKKYYIKVYKSSHTKLTHVIDVQAIDVNFKLWLVVIWKKILERNLPKFHTILGIVDPRIQ